MLVRSWCNRTCILSSQDFLYMHMTILTYLHTHIYIIYIILYTGIQSYVVGVEEVGHLEVTVDHPSLVKVLQTTQQLCTHKTRQSIHKEERRREGRRVRFVRSTCAIAASIKMAKHSQARQSVHKGAKEFDWLTTYVFRHKTSDLACSGSNMQKYMHNIYEYLSQKRLDLRVGEPLMGRHGVDQLGCRVQRSKHSNIQTLNVPSKARNGKRRGYTSIQGDDVGIILHTKH